MVALKCRWCSYKFNYTRDIPPERCPYCDRADGLGEPETAQDILDDSGKYG